MATINMKPKAPSIDFIKYLVDLSVDIAEPTPLISFIEKPVMTRGNISCISGQAKSRKTFFVIRLVADLLEDDDSVRVVIFDTEMGKYNTHKTANRIHRLLDWENKNDERLHVYNLRELGTEQRKEFITEAIKHFKYDFVVIDGVKDICCSINDEREATDITNLLMKLSSEYNCHICCCLHENKGGGNGIIREVRGHLGTEVVNKCETVISVTKEGDTSKAEARFCRGADFDPIYFRIVDGLPEYCETIIQSKVSNKLKLLFDELLSEGATLPHSILCDKIMEHCGVLKRGAEKKIKNAIAQNIIVKNAVGHYHSFGISLSTETEINF